LLITVDIYADHPGRSAEVALFAALIVVGYVVLAALPPVLRGAGVTMIVIGVPAALAWWLLPHAKSFSDVRPFLVLTIFGLGVCWVVPLSRGRVVFVGVALVVLWLWMIGEAGGNDAYSAAPIPSPPAHSMFSLAAFGGRSSVALGDLDSSDPLYPLAESCDGGDMSACDSLYRSAPFGSDFRSFGGSCGNTFIGTPGFCANSSSSLSPFPRPRVSLASRNDKSFEIGAVSLLLGLAYLAGLYVFDRRGLDAFATAFVVPGALALFTGTTTLGNAAHHAWIGGLLTFAVGLVLGVVGHRTGRRFTAWAGGLGAAIGAVTIALDVSHVSRSTSSDNVKLAGPGLIVIAFGVGLVAVAYIVAALLEGPRPVVSSRGPGGPGAPAVVAGVAPESVGARVGDPAPSSPATWPVAPPAPPSPSSASPPAPPPWPPVPPETEA
jgi:hypothetical protein